MKFISGRMLLLPLLLLLSACSGTGMSMPSFTQAEAKPEPVKSQYFQTTKGLAFASTVAALQDLGYEVQSADYTTGIIRALGSSKRDYVPYIGNVSARVSATAAVEQIGANTTQVRLNLLSSRDVDDSYGAKYSDTNAVGDAGVYQNMFGKIAGNVDMRKQLQQQNGHRAIQGFIPRMIALLPADACVPYAS